MPDYRSGPSPYTPYQPYQIKTYGSTQPVPKFNPSTLDGGTGGGGMDWLWNLLGKAGDFLGEHGGDILKTGGDIVGGVLDRQTAEKALTQRKDEFDKTFGLSQGDQAMRAQNARNRAGLLDKGTYLAQNYTPPEPFKPRDWTQGVSNIRGQATGGAAAQLAANQTASANYKPGAGGIDTSVVDSVIKKYQGAQPPANPNAPPTTTGSDEPLEAIVARTQYPPAFFPTGLPERPTMDVAMQEWNRIYPGKQPPPPTSREFGDFWNRYRQAYNARIAGGQ